MENYEWKQWEDFKKLHAVVWWPALRDHIAACGISQPSDCEFIMPPQTTIKCKNCERELNGK